MDPVTGYSRTRFAGLAAAIVFLLGCDSKEVPDWYGATSLKPILAAQAAFKHDDRDGNGHQDFWRQDVAGLATLIRNGQPIGLIELSQAMADERPVTNVAMLRERKPKAGYWFRAIRFGDERTPDPNRFAVCAFPDNPNVNRWTFIVDHNNQVYRKQLGGLRGVEVYPANPASEGWAPVD